MNTKALTLPKMSEIRAAAEMLRPHVMLSPLMPLYHTERYAQTWLKLENLQSTGSFKLRPMANILLNTDAVALENGVYTASSGNAGLGLAQASKTLNVSTTVYVPETAPTEKLHVLRRLGAKVTVLAEEEWWKIIVNSGHPDDPGLYVDAVRNPLAMAGNGTIGLEIIDHCPGLDTVYIPFGGGGLTCGIASAIRALKPDAKIIVAESDTAAPVSAALAAGRPVPVPFGHSFISGAGAVSVLDEMWPLISELVDDTVVVPLSAVANAVRILFEQNKTVAEGAGAIAVAAAMAHHKTDGLSVCIVSGGNIDPVVLEKILKNQRL